LKFDKELEDDKKEKIIRLLEEYDDVYMYGEKKLKTTNVVKHKIYLEKKAKPVTQKEYRESKENKKVIKQEIEKMLKDGVVRESSGPYLSPVVIVKKKDKTKDFVLIIEN
jgi:hypothetical protein